MEIKVNLIAKAETDKHARIIFHKIAKILEQYRKSHYSEYLSVTTKNMSFGV